MIIRMLEKEDIPVASMLIREGYDKFVARDYTPEGTVHFYEYVTEEALAERIEKGTHFSMVAVADGELVGIIEMRDFDHCTLFFVKARYHGQGIGRWLFEEAVAQCQLKKPNLRTIGVHSSPYAVPVYKRLGFENVGTLQEEHGSVYQPMVRNL